MKLQENVPLAPLTTFRIGGPARWYCDARSVADLKDALAWARTDSVGIFILGAGSNVLVSDKGFPGLVLRPDLRGIRFEETSDGILLTAAAGESWDDVVAFSVRHDWQGIECLSWVPGTVGAAPVQNIGCYGQSFSDVAESVSVLDLNTGEERSLSFTDCEFGYRSSIFNRNSRPRFIVLDIAVRLTPDGKPHIAYRDLVDFFHDIPTPALSDVREALLTIRDAKGMVQQHGMNIMRTAGSFFKNPTVPVLPSPNMRHWPQLDGTFKLSAAWLIEQSGIAPGTGLNRFASTSPYQPLALIAHDDATAEHVIELARHIRENVRRVFGILLESEVQFVGFSSDPLPS